MNTPGWQLFIAAALGVVMGLVSAAFTIENAIAAGSVKNGEWHSNANVGSPDASMYLRAAIAVKGLLGLRREEVIYFSAETDADGRPLTAECDYNLVGTTPDARWWSVTVYGEDNFLIDNDWDLYSASGASITSTEDGSFTIRLSAEKQPGDWIPTAGTGEPAESSFDLTLRLYNPSEVVFRNMATTPLPRISRLPCDYD